MAPKGKTLAPVDKLGRELVDQIRQQADRRIDRVNKEFDLGVVMSTNPLQIQAQQFTTRPVILNAGDVLVLPGVPVTQGGTVALVKTRSNETIAFPVILGSDIQEAPTFSGSTQAGTDPNNTSVQSEPSVGGPAGERVIAKALSYLGVKETGTNTDGGGAIDGWQTRWGLSNEPWCGCFADAMYKEAGVNDDGIGSPSTSTIYSTALAAGKIRSTPVKGCMAVKTPGAHGHVTLYIDGPVEAANCIGGNQGDAVTKRTYDIRGWFYCTPSAILVDANASSASTTSNGTSGAASPRPADPVGDIT